MPRSPDGTYTLPEPDVIPGEIVSSGWANSTMNDIAQALTESLSTEGEGGMSVPLQFGDGTVGAPGISWINEPTTGLYRASLGDMRVSVLGTDVFRWIAGNAQLWDGAAWNSLLIAGQAGSVPDGSNDGEGLVWDDTGKVWTAAFPAAFNTSYDASGDTTLTANNVQGALGETDVVLTSYTLHAADDLIHWDDVPNDDVVYNRRNSAWIPSVTGVSAHDQLTGLGAPADDHPQYLTDARGDAKYPALADYDAHVADTDIHFADAPADGSPYARQDNAWIASGGSAGSPMVGEMRLWFGSLATLQPGWYFCDGTNGTPDLRGRVPFGAGGAYTEGVSAGATAVTRDVASGGAHSHSVFTTTGVATDDRGENGDHTHNMVPQVVQSGTGVTVASNAQPSMQGNDHYHFGTGTASQGAGTNHVHQLVDADPPHFVVTGFILYTGVI